MLRKITLIVTLAFFSISSFGQNIALDWVKPMVNTSNITATVIKTTPDGYIYTLGSFDYLANFDNGLSNTSLNSVGTYDAFLIKYDTSGNFIWVKRVAGPDRDQFTCMDIDAAGNIYLAGSYNDSADFDPGAGSAFLHSNGEDDIFIMKLDQNGNYVWSKSLGGVEDDYAGVLQLDQNGHLFLTGNFQKTVDFDPGLGVSNLTAATAGTGTDIYVLRLDTAGNFISVKQVTELGQLSDYVADFKLDHFGNYYLVGNYYLGGSNSFVLKYDSTNNLIWANGYGGGSSGSAYQIEIFQDSLIYIAGFLTGTTDFTPNSSTSTKLTAWASSTDGYLLKLDTAGSFRWVKQIAGLRDVRAVSIALESGGDIFLSGTYKGTVYLDSLNAPLRLLNNGLSTKNDIFIAKYDQSGHALLAKRISGPGEDFVRKIYPTTSHGFYMTGRYNSSNADFDIGLGVKNLPHVAYLEAFILKIVPCANTTSTVNMTICRRSSYTSPSGKYSWDTTGTYLDTIANTKGCDSILTINLTVQGADTSITNHSPALIANASNASFQWYDCFQLAIVSGATSSTFIPATNGNYSVIVNQNGCIDTSDCFAVTNVSVNSITKNARINIYPNPTSKSISIDWPASIQLDKVVVRNTMGQKVFETVIHQDKNIAFELPLPPGIYFLELLEKNSSKTRTFKVLKL